jgi:hypothetical protein
MADELMALAQQAQRAKLADELYGAFAYGETGSFKNPWIRTTHKPKGGSSAFGPVQITNTKLVDYVTRANQTGLSPESIEFAVNVLLPMQEKMLKYGGSDMVPGFEDYDYGGTGKFDTEKYAQAYEKLAKEMLLHDYERSGGDMDGTIKLWRGVADDKRYNEAVKSKIKRRK